MGLTGVHTAHTNQRVVVITVTSTSQGMMILRRIVKRVVTRGSGMTTGVGVTQH